MPKTIQPPRRPHEIALGVLVVSASADVRARLAAKVWQALPTAEIHELSQLTDLVYRVAGSRVGLLVLDAKPQQPSPLTPLLVQMLKGIQPTLRIVSVVQDEPLLTPATDATLTEFGLGSWLRTVYGSHGSNGGNDAADPSACLTAAPAQHRPD